MSYTNTSDLFTIAELHEMGLVGDDVVVTARTTGSPQFHIGTADAGPQALLLDEGQFIPDSPGVISIHDDRIYISGDPGRLEVRFYGNKADHKTLRGSYSAASLTRILWAEPQKGTRIYQDSNFTVTYQGADNDGSAILQIVK